MVKVIYDESKFSSSHLCGRCLLRGNCPLKEPLKKAGIIDDPSSRAGYCSFFRGEAEEKEKVR